MSTWSAILTAFFVVMAGACVLSIFLRGNKAVIEGHVRAALDEQAADWGEPTRADIEWDMWVDEALRMSETPIHDQLAIDRLHADLNNEAAVVLWLRGAK